MFWGCSVKANKPHVVPAGLSDVLKVSNLAITPKSNGRSSVYLQVADQSKILLSNLEVSKTDQVSVDLFVRVSDNVTFSLEGQGEVHVSGYFEPDSEDMSDAEGNEEFAAMYKNKLTAEAAGDEDSDSEEEEAPVVRKASKTSKTSKDSAPKPKRRSSKDLVAALENEDIDLDDLDEDQLAQLEAELAEEAMDEEPVRKASKTSKDGKKSKKAEPVVEESDDEDVNLDDLDEDELAELEAELEGEDDESEEEVVVPRKSSKDGKKAAKKAPVVEEESEEGEMNLDDLDEDELAELEAQLAAEEGEADDDTEGDEDEEEDEDSEGELDEDEVNATLGKKAAPGRAAGGAPVKKMNDGGIPQVNLIKKSV